MSEFWKRKRPDGTLGKVYWTHLGGKRVSTGCQDLRAAQIWRRAQERDGADPRIAASKETSLESCFLELHAELIRRGRSDATRNRAKEKLGHFARLWGKDMPIGNVNATLVNRYVDERLNDGVKRLTIRDELAFLRQVLRIAKRAGVYPHHHEDVLPIAFDPGETVSNRWLRPEHAEKLLAHVEPRHAAHLCFILATGCRLGESYRARRSDVDMKNWIVTLHRTKHRKSPTKTVSIDKFMQPYLRRAIADAEGDDFLFLDWPNIQRDMKLACGRAKIPPVTARDLRRSFGKWHRMHGYAPADIGTLLGHTDDTLAQKVYATVEGADVRDIVKYRAASESYKKRTEQPKKQQKAGKR